MKKSFLNTTSGKLRLEAVAFLAYAENPQRYEDELHAIYSTIRGMKTLIANGYAVNFEQAIEILEDRQANKIAYGNGKITAIAMDSLSLETIGATLADTENAYLMEDVEKVKIAVNDCLLGFYGNLQYRTLKKLFKIKKRYSLIPITERPSFTETLLQVDRQLLHRLYKNFENRDNLTFRDFLFLLMEY